MVMRRATVIALLAGGVVFGGASLCEAQCCLDGLFAGCASCFRKAPPAYAVAPMAAPVMAPIPAPPPPVMVPMQQVSYVPETTYQTKYECVPVTSYRPSCEIDPCTGCTRECMEQVVSYQQRPVSVPVTQYRPVYSTKYVQMQPGFAPQAPYGAPPAGFQGAPPAASPFSAPMQTSPGAWAPAGADVPQQLIPNQPGIGAPTLPATSPQTYTLQRPVVPQSGISTTTGAAQPQLQPTAPPMLAPAPSLKPIPDTLRTAPQSGSNGASANGTGNAAGGSSEGATGNGKAAGTGSSGDQGRQGLPMVPVHPSASPVQGGSFGQPGMPVVPGPGPSPATGAFPKLLEPTGHTTQYQPAVTPTSAWQPFTTAPAPRQVVVPPQQPAAYASGQARGGYPTAALPIRSQQ